MELPENSRDKAVSYDSFFEENYQALQRWALQITTYDRELAEDLVHDIYLRFSRRDQITGEVDSVHGYLYAALKNAYVSHLRNKTRTGSRQFSLFDHEFADNVWLTVDPRSSIKVHDELRAICEFACNRKAASSSASILILRFFHGYFTAEVARITGRSRNAVEARLLKARREMALHLSGETKWEKSKNPGGRGPAPLIARHDLLLEMRERIFEAVEGICLSVADLSNIYKKSKSGLNREELSHIVSCRKCLERVNGLLRMPRLSERHPLDTLGAQSTIETLQCSMSRAAWAGSIVLLSLASFLGSVT